jgi:hypothetical protein
MALKINNIDFPDLAGIAADYYKQERAQIALALKKLEALNSESKDINYLIDDFKNLLDTDIFDANFAIKENLTLLIKRSEYTRNIFGIGRTLITSDGDRSAYLKAEDLLNSSFKKLPRLSIFMNDDQYEARQILLKLQAQHEILRKTYMQKFLAYIKDATVDKLKEFTSDFEEKLGQVKQLNANNLTKRNKCLEAHRLVDKLKQDINNKSDVDVSDLTETLSVVTKKYIDPFMRDPAEKDLWNRVTDFIRLMSVTVGGVFSVFAITLLVIAIAFPPAIPVVGTAIIAFSIVAGVFSLTPAFVTVAEVFRNAYYGRGATQDQAKEIGVVLCSIAVCVGLGSHSLSAVIKPIGKVIVAISRMALSAISNSFRLNKLSKTAVPKTKALAPEIQEVAPKTIPVIPATEITKPTRDEFFVGLDKNLFEHFTKSDDGMLIAQPVRNALKTYLELDKATSYELRQAKLLEFEVKIEDFEKKINPDLLDDVKHTRLQEAKEFVSLEKLDLEKERVQNHIEPEKPAQNEEIHMIEAEG